MLTDRRPSIGAAVALLDPSNEGSRVGFGCAGLMQLPTRRGRQLLLGEAFDCGFTHFDVARMYGLGMAEAELGRFAAGRRREQVTIATKFGIDSGAPRLARLQGPARYAMARVPALRDAARRRAGDGPRERRRYDAAGARASLETSLRQLGTDHVDLFFIHDPGPGDEVDLEGIAELCEGLVQRGTVRAWGVSGDPDPCLGLTRDGGMGVLQVRDDVFAPIATSPQLPPRIGFGILEGALARLLNHLAVEGRQRWSAAIGRDCGRAETLATLLLSDALERNRGGGVLFATTRCERLGAAAAVAAQVASGGVDPALAAFRECLRADFGPPRAAGG